MADLHGGHFDPSSRKQPPTQVQAQTDSSQSAVQPASGYVPQNIINNNVPHGGSNDPGAPAGPASPPQTVWTQPPNSPPPSVGYQSPPPPQSTQVYTQQVPWNGQPQMTQYPQYPTHQTYQQGADIRPVNGQGDSNMETKEPVIVIASRPGSNQEHVEKEFPVVLKGSLHVSEPRTKWRWLNPILYQNAGYTYNDSTTKHRHRDFAGRVTNKPRSDRYLHHYDGYLRNMYVACTDDIYEGEGTTTWKRTYVHKVAPIKVRLATWVVDFSYDPSSWNDWWIQLLRALPAAIAMSVVFWDLRPVIRHNLLYAPILYAYHGEAKVWSNLLENRGELPVLARNNQPYRQLKPRHLRFLNKPGNKEICGSTVRLVDDWEQENGEEGDMRYLFVAYSTQHFRHNVQADVDALHHIAETACRAAKLPAYWIACSCMRIPEELEADVFRIADVLRGSQSMIIAVGRGKSAETSAKPDTISLLREWGDRMWTFPEVLLCPERSVKVYNRDRDLSSPLVIPKNQFASKVWTFVDPDVSRHLIDHYIGNMNLSRLELAVLALRCLYSRHTTEHLSGDQAYALMGLLRLRPQVDKTDSAFQAFARLSLANDSDMLLERYMCTLPVSPTQPWYSMEDAYQSSLWDITPHCQVAAIADDDTIIMDGAKGLSVRWKCFYPVWWSTGPSWKRWFAMWLVEYNGFILIGAISLMAAGGATSTGPGLIAAGVFLLLLFLYYWLMTPYLVRTIYGGKFCDVQAEMFGFEGHLNAPTIERAIFGGNFSRFSWSINGSPLSRSYVNEFGERLGIDPYLDPEIKVKVENAKRARPGDMRVFTLVDTYNMQLTLFEAIRPPVTLVFGGSEGGMQRAIGCSYEWTNQTFYRETVLRLPTTTLNRMDRVPRLRMGIHRPNHPSQPRNGVV